MAFQNPARLIRLSYTYPPMALLRRLLKIKLIRRLLLGTSIFLAFLLIIAGLLLYSLDDLVRRQFNAHATSALGVQAQAQNVHIGLLSGSIKLNELTVANPEGFSRDDFLSIQHIAGSIQTDTIASDLITFDQVEVTGVTLNLEQRAERTNYQVIVDNLVKTREQVAAAIQSHAPGGSTRHLIIKRLIVRDVTVNAAEFAGDTSTQADHQTYVLDEIELTQIGTNSESGVVIEQVVSLVTASILRQAAIQGIGKLPSRIIVGLGDGILALGDLGITGVRFGGQLLIDAGMAVLDGAGHVVKGLGHAIGSLFDDEKTPHPQGAK